MQPFRRILLALAIGAPILLSQNLAPAGATQILATLTVREGIPRDQFMKVMPGEVRATVQLYLDGRIQQWFSRGDGKGVVFVLNCKTIDEAKELMDALPLSKAKFASFDYMALAPLKPLSLLLTPAP